MPVLSIASLTVSAHIGTHTYTHIHDYPIDLLSDQLVRTVSHCHCRAYAMLTVTVTVTVCVHDAHTYIVNQLTCYPID